MNAHALGVLEFSRVLDAIAGHASAPLAAERIRGASPSTDGTWLDREHARLAAARQLVEDDTGWRPEPIPDLIAALGVLAVAGAVWSGIELRLAAGLLRSSRLMRSSLNDSSHSSDARRVLAPLTDRLVSDPTLERQLDRVVDGEGVVRDDASPELRRLRRELQAANGELIRILERALARLDPTYRVSDMSITVRNGRHVIPVRREGRHTVAGILHDSSSTGNTLFIEPVAAVEFGNRIREMQAEESAEVDRVLASTTDTLRPHAEGLSGALDALVELDTFYARARFARRFECAAIALADPKDGFAFRGTRHPLLLVQGVSVVPFDLEMSGDERILLVSGPNTGGKTVLLKAIGLIAALTQAGMPVPVGAGSRSPVFDDVFADIGDEQSIEASLSTFSAHVKNLGEILDRASPQSLVLVDELGSGTDPSEGAALGAAILEELAVRGTITAVTTHLGSLKELAGRVAGVVNASLQFDTQALAPTYRLIKGVPGRSYGIAIARRLRLSAAVIARAEAELPESERQTTALLDRLERRDEEAAVRERELTGLLDDARGRLAELDDREARLRERERFVEREGRSEARRYLLEARTQIERVIQDLRANPAQVSDDRLRTARQHVEAMAANHAAALKHVEDEQQRGPARPAERKQRRREIRIGDRVEVAAVGGSAGRVLAWREESAVVAIGAVKLTVPRSDLIVLEEPHDAPPASVAPNLPESHARTEVDLRGLRAVEAERLVQDALDSAVREDLPSLRIIHGKGTGALRARVTELLSDDRRVKTFRPGAWNEGGAGVTVVALK